MDAALKELLRPIRKWAAGKRIVKRVYFFGSRAKGTNRSDSDLDVAVELIYEEFGTALAHWMAEEESWLSELQGLIPFEVDLELLHATESVVVAKGIEEGAILVYESQ